jgi:hypothetical protein
MEAGTGGVIGQLVVQRAKVELKYEPDFATALPLPVADPFVWGQAPKLRPATYSRVLTVSIKTYFCRHIPENAGKLQMVIKLLFLFSFRLHKSADGRRYVTGMARTIQQ